MIEMHEKVYHFNINAAHLAKMQNKKIDAREEKSSVLKSVQVLKKSEQSSFDFNQSQKDYKLNTFGFGSNIFLESKDSTQLARITEYREGKPFRSLEVVNATYAENKTLKDSATSKVNKELTQRHNNLRMLYSEQNLKIQELETKQEHIKSEAAKLANNFKYAIWLLLSIVLIYICERAGLFRLFKKLWD